MFIHEIIEKRRMSMNNARVIQCESFDIECFEGNGRIEKVTTFETPQIQIGHLNSKFLEIYEKCINKILEKILAFITTK